MEDFESTILDIIDSFVESVDVYGEFRRNCSFDHEGVTDAPRADAWNDDILRYTEDELKRELNDTEKRVLFELWEDWFDREYDDMCEYACDWYRDYDPR